ncbi:MAG: hypothetical protein K8H90_00410, partial [Thermoanaerobaculia bacterium]|nr:hypothetical protein [Thermoanaerobaculia bacterium]
MKGATSQSRRDFLGVSLTALCGGALALNLLLILGLLGLIGYQGGRFFWQKDLLEVTLDDGRKLLGEVHDGEVAPPAEPGGPERPRLQMRLGNRDLTGGDFQWVDEPAIAARAFPADAVVLERLEWGNFYGRMVELRDGDRVLASGDGVWSAFVALHERKVATRAA